MNSPQRSLLRAPVLAAAGVVAVLVVTLLLVGAAGGQNTSPSGGAPPGAVLGEDDRRAIAAAPVERGEEPAPADPAVDLTDPEAVARAYLTAAHSVLPGDAGHTHLRAAGYAEPGSAAAAVGVVVLDAPPAGSVRTAEVTGLALIAVDHNGSRRGYRAEIGTATGPPGGPVAVELLGRHVVLARHADGRWLVVAETVESPDLPAGED